MKIKTSEATGLQLDWGLAKVMGAKRIIVNWRGVWVEDGMYLALSGDWVRVDDVKTEIDALKAQNAELLAALTESLAYVEATLSNHDAGCQRHPSTEHARDCILSDLDQIKTAIAKARGDL